MQQRLMSGYDKPTAGHRRFCRVKSCSSAGPPTSPSLDRIIAAKNENGPPPVLTWPKMPFRCAQFFGETAVSLINFCCAIQRHICRLLQALARKSRSKMGMARRLNPASQVKVRVSQLSSYQSWYCCWDIRSDI